MLRSVRLPALMIALASMGVAGIAHGADLKAKARTETLQAASADQNAWGSPNARNTLQWNADGRWSLNLAVDPDEHRNAQFKDVEAGAFLRLTPSLRVGGAVGLTDQSDPQRFIPPENRPQPKVKLETMFRF